MYDGLYWTGWRGGLGFVRLTGTTAKVYPVLFDRAATLDAWRITCLDIPLPFAMQVELER